MSWASPSQIVSYWSRELARRASVRLARLFATYGYRMADSLGRQYAADAAPPRYRWRENGDASSWLCERWKDDSDTSKGMCGKPAPYLCGADFMHCEEHRESGDVDTRGPR